MIVVSSVKFLHNDRIEKLLNFRAEYREKLKVSRPHADQFARAEALRMLVYAVKESLVRIVIFGKRIMLE